MKSVSALLAAIFTPFGIPALYEVVVNLILLPCKYCNVPSLPTLQCTIISWLNFEFFLATELGKTLYELRTLITQEELVYWAAYYELKIDREQKEMQRQKAKSR